MGLYLERLIFYTEWIILTKQEVTGSGYHVGAKGVSGVEQYLCNLCFNPTYMYYWFIHFEEVLEIAAMRNYRGSLSGHSRQQSKWECLQASDRQTDRQARQTKSQRLWTQTDTHRMGENELNNWKKQNKKKKTSRFRNNDFPAWAVAISMSLTEHRAYQAYCITWGKKGKGRNNQKCIRNNALFRLYPSLFRHPRSFTRSEWAEGGGRGTRSRSHSQRARWVIKLCVAL